MTIRDVAEKVGVHHSTVSRALSPTRRDKISPEVVAKVEKAAQKLGYFPNLVASSLKQNRSFTVGVLIPDLTNPLFPPIITTAQRQDRIVEECIANDIPFVLVNRTVDQPGVNAVVVDEDLGIRAVLQHLVGLNHERIAHLAGPKHTSTGFWRTGAFESVMQEYGLEGDLIEVADKYTIEEGKRVFTRLLSRDNSFTALVAANDMLALGCLDAMNEVGLVSPTNISVTGYDDIQFLERMSPPLTTMQVPKYEMGSRAARILLEMIDGGGEQAIITRVPPRLIVRNSTARASR